MLDEGPELLAAPGIGLLARQKMGRMIVEVMALTLGEEGESLTSKGCYHSPVNLDRRRFMNVLHGRLQVSIKVSILLQSACMAFKILF